jgi:hypothetical protein
LCLCDLQAFLDVYATLREELLSDKLLEGQPQAAKDWLKEVSRDTRDRGGGRGGEEE